MYTQALSAAFLKTARLFVIIFALLLAYAIMPTPVHASGLSEAQMQSVTDLLKSFGVESSVVENVQMALKGAPREEVLKAMGGKTIDKHASSTKVRPSLPAQASICAVFARTLNRGAVGDDVNKLQEFLKHTGDLKEASTTNYFGPATEAALKAWQAREKIVVDGDPATTGFGAVGPKTRQMLMERCKGLSNDKERPDTSNKSKDDKLSCVLKPSSYKIQEGESVTLRWESKNATWASTASGEKGEVSGSIVVAPTETTTYLKRVYNADGESQCIATVIVGDDKTPAAEKKVVMAPTINVSHTLSLMGSGMAAVLEGYLSLFER